MNQATSTTAPMTNAMSLADTQKALAHATALLRDAAMYVGSKACSGGLTGEIFKFLHATVPAEQMALPAVAVYTGPTTVQAAAAAAEIMCGHVDRISDSGARESTQGSMAGAADIHAAATPCAA